METRIVELVTLDVPGLDEPAVGQLISLPVTRPPRLNQLYLRRGRQLSVGRDDEVLASEAFLKANNLDIGSTISAIINGRRKDLHVVGVAFSPEYVFQIKPGDMLPDPKHFGILWMEHEAVSTAYDMDGAFNDVTISLTHAPLSTMSSIASIPCWSPMAASVRSLAKTSSRTCSWKAISKACAVPA